MRATEKDNDEECQWPRLQKTGNIEPQIGIGNTYAKEYLDPWLWLWLQDYCTDLIVAFH